MLCENRFVLPGSPSTCVVDTALIPLPSFLLVLFGAYFLLRPSHDSSRTVVPRWIHIVYMILVVATIGMTVVVVVRNIIDHLGVGLIPMVIGGLILVFVGLWYEDKGRSQPLSALFFIYWILNIVFQSIKVVRMQQLNQLDPGKKSQYPSSDQLLDNAVILGCYVTFLFIEGFVLVLSRRPGETAYHRPQFSRLNKMETV